MSHVNGIKISREYMLVSFGISGPSGRKGYEYGRKGRIQHSGIDAGDCNDGCKHAKEGSGVRHSKTYERASRITRMVY